MKIFLVLGHSTDPACTEQASGVCGQGATQRDAAENYYLTYCAALGVDPDAEQAVSAHHEQMIDVKVALETSPLGEPVEFPQDDFVLCAVAVDVPQVAAEPQPFAHVEDKALAKFLMGDVSEDAMCSALTKTRAALESDLENDDLHMMGKVLEQRQDALPAGRGRMERRGRRPAGPEPTAPVLEPVTLGPQRR